MVFNVRKNASWHGHHAATALLMSKLSHLMFHDTEFLAYETAIMGGAISVDA